MNGCKFCQLLALPDLGRALPNLVVKTDRVVVVLNRRPAGPGHVTLILQAHQEQTSQFADAHLSGLGDLVGRLSGALERLHAPGRVILLGDGKRSAHLHLHLIPEAAGTSLDLGAVVSDLNLATRPATLPDADLASAIAALRRALD